MPERQCHECTNQDEWGCNAYPTDELDSLGNPVWQRAAWIPLEIDGEEVWRCPRRPLKDAPAAWSRMLQIYGFYLKGFLPDPGGVMDQSARTMALFALIDHVNNEVTEEKIERARDKQAPRP